MNAISELSEEEVTVKQTLTKYEYFQLLGLLTLAAHHNVALKDIEQAACALTGDTAGTGHTFEAIIDSDITVEVLLARLHITVQDAPMVGE